MIVVLSLLAVVVVVGGLIVAIAAVLVSTPGEHELGPMADPPDPVPVPAWVEFHFLPGEYAFYADNPQMALLVTRLIPDFVVVVLLGFVALRAGTPWVAWLAVALVLVPVVDAVVQFMVWDRTMYVLTPLRAIRFSGWLNSDVEWLSWGKVTEVSIRKTWVDHLFRMATIDIHTAHSASSFRAMRDVERPREFARDVASKSLL